MAERFTVDEDVAGSSPVSHPTEKTLVSCARVFCHPLFGNPAR
jgi:hypothetical protein